MDDSDGFILFIVGAIVFAGLFYGVTFGIKKAFRAQPATNMIDSASMQKKQKEKNDAIEYERKMMMEQLKQRNKDYRRKNNF